MCHYCITRHNKTDYSAMIKKMTLLKKIRQNNLISFGRAGTCLQEILFNKRQNDKWQHGDFFWFVCLLYNLRQRYLNIP